MFFQIFYGEWSTETGRFHHLLDIEEEGQLWSEKILPCVSLKTRAEVVARQNVDILNLLYDILYITQTPPYLKERLPI